MAMTKKISGVLFFGIGIFLLTMVVRKYGGMQLLNTVSQVGWRIIFVLALPLTWYSVQTLAWYWILEETGQHLSFWSLLKIKLSGEAVNTLTPMSWMGGDPVRIYLMQKQMPGTLSTASTVLDRTIQSTAIVVFLLIGLTVAWIFLDMPSQWRHLFPILTGALLVLVVFFINRQKKGIFKYLVKILSFLKIKRFDSEYFQEKIEALDQRISDFYHHDPKRFFLSLSAHVCGRLLGVIEIYLIAQLLGISLEIEGALFLASLTVLINMMFVFIPGSIGVMEGAYGGLFYILGQSPELGVAIQLVRRIRTLFWIFVGLLVMMIYSKIHRTQIETKKGTI